MPSDDAVIPEPVRTRSSAKAPNAARPPWFRGRARLIAGLLGVSAGFLANPALAHFNLQAPPSWAMQDASGNPQKSAPCGQADPMNTAQPTGTVTAFAPGQTITITINETVYHPGHYRVALVKDRSQLPADPPVTAGNTACGSTVIEASPMLPLLADGQLVHTSKFSGAQSFQVKLPSDMTCDKCTLQVVEFMSNHILNNPGGCFYHHCADISIGAGGGAGGATGSGGAAGGAGKTGTGGANGGAAGGAGKTGTGGANGGAGGAANGGAGGANAGGTTSAGGASSGGATSTGGASSGGATGSGGVSSGGATSAGGASTGGAATPSGATAGGSAGTPDENGCGCSMPGRQGQGSLALGLLLISALLRTRRRDRSRSPD